MHCENCSSQIPENSVFCSECGAKVEKQEVSPPLPTPQPSPYESQPAAYHAAEPQQNYASSSTPPPYYAAAAPSAASAPYVKPLGVGSYLGMILLTAIPIVGIILLFVWAFSSDTNLNRKNYARAVLIMMLISIVLAIVFGGVMAGIASMIGDALYYY